MKDEKTKEIDWLKYTVPIDANEPEPAESNADLYEMLFDDYI